MIFYAQRRTNHVLYIPAINCTSSYPRFIPRPQKETT